jgi:AcrR family transcriptional regulator
MNVSSAASRARSPGPSAGARSRAATRVRLLESGAALFASRGLHGVTTHDVARGAGVAAGTFYLHFKDKHELFREIALGAVAELRQRLDTAAAAATDPRDAVPRLAEALVTFSEEHRELVRIVFSVDRDTSDVASDILSELAATIAAGRRQRITAGDAPPDLDPVILSQALVGMWARVIAWWIEEPGRASRETLIETLTRIQLSGTHPRIAEKEKLR